LSKCASFNIVSIKNWLSEYYKSGEKSDYWRKRAAEAGDLKSILEVYGYSEFDVTSNAYDEMLRSLNNVKPESDDESALKSYAIGMVYYKRGDTTNAKKQFELYADRNDAMKYLIANCFEKENNYVEAEKLLKKVIKDGWERSADAYMKLWGYFLNGVNGIEPDYLKSLEYAEKYANSEGMISSTANEITGKSCNKLGEAYQYGLPGYVKDVKKSYEYYVRAAEIGNTEALAIVGMSLLNGEIDGIYINRDYFKANDYLRRASFNGNQQAKECFEKFGVDGVIVAPIRPKTTTYKFMDGHELTATSQTITWLHLLYGIRYKPCRIRYRNPLKREIKCSTCSSYKNCNYGKKFKGKTHPRTCPELY